MLSCLSVNTEPSCCLRHWCSSEYLHISLLHSEFHNSLSDSRPTVLKAVSRLSREISPLTYKSACAPFTPSKSGQRLDPTYYRGCWHVVSRSLLFGYHQTGNNPSFFPDYRGLQCRAPSSLTRRCCFRLSSIEQYSSLLPPVGVWAVSQSQCG
jgi:hypothetical protein